MTPRALALFLAFVIAFAQTAVVAPALHAEDKAAADEEAAPAADDTPVDVDEALSPLDGDTEEAGTGKADVQGIDSKVSLDLRNIEVTEALRFLSQKAGINIAISKNVSGRVQLVLNDVPIVDVLDIIFVTAGLAYEKHGEIYYIMSEAEYKERYGRKFSDTRKVKVFRLKYAIPDQAFSLLEVLKSEIGRILVDSESGTVLVMDTAENISRMEKALEGLEQKRSVRVYTLKYAKALDVETRLKAQLDLKKAGAISADERTNQVIVETYPSRMEEIEKLILSLDERTKEVLIDSKIIRVSLTDDFEAEIKWEGIFRQMTSYGISFISNHPLSNLARTGQSAVDDFANITPTTLPAQTPKVESTENVVVGLVDNPNNAFEALIKFLKTVGETRVLSNPKIAVINNQEAKIHVGEKQAYVTTTTTTGQSTTTTAESVTFVDVGIQLSVTPTINDDGFVTMKIKPEISSVTSFLTTPSGNRIPIIDSSLAETAVMVKDGVSIIIAGLRREEDINNRKETPFFGKLPIFGNLFNSTSKGKRMTEIVILLTPHVIYGDKLMTGHKRGAEEPFMSYSDYTPLGVLPKGAAPAKGQMVASREGT